MEKTKVLLSEEDFEHLIKGNTVKTKNVEIALPDIGYLRMFQILNKEIAKRWNKNGG